MPANPSSQPGPGVRASLTTASRIAAVVAIGLAAGCVQRSQFDAEPVDAGLGVDLGGAGSDAAGSDPAGSDHQLGVLRIALSEVPPDVLCLQITLSDGLRRIVRQVGAATGTTLTTTQSRLPVGPVTIALDAFGESCTTVTDSSMPTWVSGVVNATLVDSMPVMLSINLSRPGSATITAVFPGDGGVPPAVAVSPAMHDFGSVAAGNSSAAFVFTVTNNAASPVTFTASASSAPTIFRIDSNTCTSSVAPGGSCTVGVRFAPVGVGLAQLPLTVQSSLGATGTSTLLGNGTAGASINPSFHDFGALPVGAKSAPFVFTVTNLAGSPVTYTASAASAPTIFRVESNTCTTPVPPMGTCSIGVTFAPVGLAPVQLDLSVESSLTFSFSAPLSGSGTPGVTIAPASHDFNSVVVGASSLAFVFTVTNNATVPVTYTASAASAPTIFKIDTNTCTTPVQPLATCSVGVRFAPVAVGPAELALSVESSLGFLATATMVGNGTPGATINPTAHDFGSVAVGTQSAPFVFTVTNLAATAVTYATSFAGPSAFNVASSTCTSPVSPAGTCAIGVRFAPTALGPAQVLLTAESSLAFPVTVTLTGNGGNGAAAIAGLVVNDTTPGGDGIPNNSQWSIQANFQTGQAPFGDRAFTVESIGNTVLTGKPWIRTAADSKSFTGSPLATFLVNGSFVFLVIDNRHNGADGRPAWLDSTWVDQSFDVVIRQSGTTTFPYSVWRKPVIAGSTVNLPTVNSSFAPGYFVIVQ
jgi:hypothetical protein